jgi:hypothetical protein
MPAPTTDLSVCRPCPAEIELFTQDTALVSAASGWTPNQLSRRRDWRSMVAARRMVWALTASMATSCGFCGRLGVTKEHLWSDWMRLGILESRTADGSKSFQAEIERRGETKRYKNPTLEQRVRMPCRECNSGWMSVLENDIKPFLTPLVLRGETVLLSPERQLALSRWAVKTAMVYEFTSAPEEPEYFSAAERLAFKERFEIPDNVWIWIGRYDGVRPMHAVLRRARHGPEAPLIHSLTFSANFMVLQVFAYRASAGDWARVANATRRARLLQLWPASDWQSWPPKTAIDDDALAVLDDRFVNVPRGDLAPPSFSRTSASHEHR